VKPLRILLLAPGAHPDSFSSALVGYSHSEALARVHSVTLMTGPSNAAAIQRRQHPFKSIEVIHSPLLQRFHDFCFRWIFKGMYTSQALTAFNYPFCLYFEWRTWRRMRQRIKKGDFDVVLRLMPITAVIPSLFPFLLRRGPIPVVIGPINGGLPWPEGFTQANRQKEWISNLRNLYRFMPFVRSTYRDAKAIVAGSSQTYSEFATYREKLFFVPENGVSRFLFENARPTPAQTGILELVFIGALVPIKGCDLGLRAAAPLLRDKLAHFTIVGDGPDRARLEQLARSLGVEHAVTFRGTLQHGEAMKCMREGDVFVFPSIRDFGAGVVFEALAMGAVPIVIDYGGPGDIVNEQVGYKVPLTSESEIVNEIGRILEELQANPRLRAELREHGMRYARESLSWEGKARSMTTILAWAAGLGQKPDLPPPKRSWSKRSGSQ
jgi:glycosyltransferase involved in cell wall biosynthesis